MKKAIYIFGGILAAWTGCLVFMSSGQTPVGRYSNGQPGEFYSPALDMATMNVTNYSSYGSGTAYAMTASAAQAAFGTTSPQVTLSAAGTYLITGGGNVKYNGATYAGSQTATMKFRRTNNTAADLANATRTIQLRIVTTITDDAGYVTVPPVIYTATAGDIIQLWGNVSATPSAGSVQVDSGEIIAVRIQ